MNKQEIDKVSAESKLMSDDVTKLTSLARIADSVKPRMYQAKVHYLIRMADKSILQNPTFIYLDTTYNIISDDEYARRLNKIYKPMSDFEYGRKL